MGRLDSAVSGLDLGVRKLVEPGSNVLLAGDISNRRRVGTLGIQKAERDHEVSRLSRELDNAAPRALRRAVKG